MNEEPLFEKPIDDLLPKGPVTRNGKKRDAPLSRFGRDTPPDELFAIGRGQRALVRLVALQLLYCLGGAVLVVALDSKIGTAVFSAGLLVINVVETIVLLRFAFYLYPTVVVLFIIPCALACFGWLAVIAVNFRATRVLRRNGIRVGFLGARRADLDHLDSAPRDRNEKMPKLGW